MRKFLRRIRASRRGFTLVECVLAAALIGTGATLVMAMVSMGYSYINRSRSLDSMSSVAQQNALVAIYSADFEATEGLVEVDEDNGISVGYSDNLEFRVAYEIYYGNSNTHSVIMPNTFEYVAVIVTDVRDNKIVYYVVSPNDIRIKDLYKEKE